MKNHECQFNALDMVSVVNETASSSSIGLEDRSRGLYHWDPGVRGYDASAKILTAWDCPIRYFVY